MNLTREQEAVARAQLEFVRLPDGGWLISRWSIRVPVIETRYETETRLPAVRRVVGRSVRQIRVDGGDLSLVTRNADTLWARPPLTLVGAVRDSSSGEGVSAAQLTLRGTGLAARSDGTGQFRISGVLPGEYVLDIETPPLASIGVIHSVSVKFADSTDAFVARVPKARDAIRSLCGAKFGGLVVGTVRMLSDSTPARDSKVVIEWNKDGDTSATQRQWLADSTDARGRFRICGVPSSTALTVRAESAIGAAAPVEARIPAEGHFAAVQLVLDPKATRDARLGGVILSDANMQPVVEAEVSLPALGKTVYTNERGDFRLTDIPAGAHRVSVRRVGYRPLNVEIAFAPNQSVERRLLLSRVIVLDTVAVEARTRLPEFEENRRMGLGHFMTRATLEKQEERNLADILNQVSGARMMRAGSMGYLASRRAMGTSIANEVRWCQKLRFEGAKAPCACYAQVYLDNALLYGGFEGETVPDINTIPPSSIEAIEYYAGPAQTPVRYSRLNAQCGVLVIHTRRTP